MKKLMVSLLLLGVTVYGMDEEEIRGDSHALTEFRLEMKALAKRFDGQVRQRRYEGLIGSIDADIQRMESVRTDLLHKYSERPDVISGTLGNSFETIEYGLCQLMMRRVVPLPTGLLDRWRYGSQVAKCNSIFMTCQTYGSDPSLFKPGTRGTSDGYALLVELLALTRRIEEEERALVRARSIESFKQHIAAGEDL